MAVGLAAPDAEFLQDLLGVPVNSLHLTVGTFQDGRGFVVTFWFELFVGRGQTWPRPTACVD